MINLYIFGNHSVPIPAWVKHSFLTFSLKPRFFPKQILDIYSQSPENETILAYLIHLKEKL